MKLEKQAGATSEIWEIFIQDKTSTVGAGLAGLVFNSAGLTAYYHRNTAVAAVAITLVTMTVGTFTSSGFKEIDATNMPGWYQICPPDAAIAAGAKSCSFHLKGAANMADLPIEVQLVAYNPDNATLGLPTPLTAAQIATGVWQDATAGDFTVASSIGKALFTGNFVPGAAGGLLIAGSNAGTTTFGALTVTGTFTVSDGLVVNRSTGNSNAVAFTGSGTGNGLAITSAGANSDAVSFGGTGTGAGFRSSGGTSGPGMWLHGSIAAGTGPGLKIDGGSTSGNAVNLTTTSGDGLSILPTAGNGIVATANGTSKHGAVITGGTAGVSDGMKLVAGSGGVDLRANQTGTITTVTNLTNLPSIPANWLTAAGINAGALNGKGDWLLASSYTAPPSVASIATGVWTDTVAGDFTTALSVGKSVMNGVALGTGLTVNDLTTKTGFSLSSTGLNSVLVSDLGAVPSATATFPDAMSFVFMSVRNARVTDSTAATDTIGNNAGAVIATATVTDTGGVGGAFTKTKYV